jgi:3-hydroxyisobutyrate dehydrogenase-like beta-hydroxyacid dehydrogenase
MNVGILGTGKMGGAMARRFAASGYEVTLWNRSPSKAQELHIGHVVATPADNARDADVIISSLTNDTALRDVYFGENGVLGAAAGKLVIDTSTAGPDIAEAIGREAHAVGVRFLEAPVIGSVPAVEGGKLLVLVAGDQVDAEQARPILEHLGEVLYVGERGSAQRLKLIANSMLGITSAAAAELLTAGTAAGLEREQVFKILARFAPGLAARERGFLHDEHTPTMFAVRDLVKDLDLASRVFDDQAGATPLTHVTHDLYAEAMDDSADLDISAIVRVLQHRN